MKITKKANAKINLTLDLTGVLPNGYHGIFTVMQSVTLSDEVTVESGEPGRIILACRDEMIPCDERNTAYKAAKLFFEAAGLPGGVTIRIEKNVPSQAGLGGGSADAAAVLSALTEAFPGKVGEKELYEIALKVGADVPFCLAGGTRLCQNIGEIMTVLPSLNAFVVIAKPAAGISTRVAYSRFDAKKKIPHPENAAFLYYAAAGDYKKAMKHAGNLFETLVPLPEGREITETLYAHGAYYAAMSGSGSAYFGLFDREEEAAAAAAQLRKSVPFAEVFHTAE